MRRCNSTVALFLLHGRDVQCSRYFDIIYQVLGICKCGIENLTKKTTTKNYHRRHAKIPANFLSWKASFCHMLMLILCVHPHLLVELFPLRHKLIWLWKEMKSKCVFFVPLATAPTGGVHWASSSQYISYVFSLPIVSTQFQEYLTDIPESVAKPVQEVHGGWGSKFRAGPHRDYKEKPSKKIDNFLPVDQGHLEQGVWLVVQDC